MFCPKCGKKLPDDATFCGGCGKRLKKDAGNLTMVPPPSNDRFATAAVPLAQSASATGQPVQRQKGGQVSPVGIVARVASLAALVCMFLPWLNVPLANSASQLVAALGLSEQRDYVYSMFNMGEVADIGEKVSSTFGAVQNALFIAWIVAVVVIVLGFVVSFTGKKTARPVIPGAVLAAGVAIAWFAFITYVNGQIVEATSALGGITAFELPPAVLLTVLFGVVSLVLAALDRPRA